MVTTTFCVSGMALAKAGDGVSTDLSAGTKQIGSDFAVDVWITEVESIINTKSKYNWTDVYSALNIDTKKILQSAASDLSAIYCILYDMSGYSTRLEAESMINVLRDNYMRTMSLLGEKENQHFIENPGNSTT